MTITTRQEGISGRPSTTIHYIVKGTKEEVIKWREEAYLNWRGYGFTSYLQYTENECV